MFGFGEISMVTLSEEGELLRTMMGSVRGVAFDLRGANLPPEMWHWPRFITTSAPGHSGIVIAAASQSESADGLAIFTPGMLEEMERKRLRDARKAKCDILFPGDRVTVANVELISRDDDPFAHDLDRQLAIVRLQADRGRGRRLLLQPLALQRRGNVSGVESALADLWERLKTLQQDPAITNPLKPTLEDRVRELHGLRSMIDGDREALKGVNEAIHKGVGALDAWSAVIAATSLERLINVAALYGYLQGRLEADIKMKPLANELIDDRKARAKGQKAGVQSRTQWKAPGLEIAKNLITANASATDEEVAIAIKEGVKPYKLNPPTIGRIMKVIASWRRIGDLPLKAKVVR